MGEFHFQARTIGLDTRAKKSFKNVGQLGQIQSCPIVHDAKTCFFIYFFCDLELFWVFGYCFAPSLKVGEFDHLFRML